ncbi:tetratricopeptide repeat protein [Leptolyngbya sp. 7M]|uniref:tetratricopeptide repeat protein n=1 Tax=Leptolyngbya sp. 7M TaxID=2812896 RepID=UPI001B8D98C2|nr:tetratricopeptide repeat protein [Leptolyngbya sp. 7M]QYO66574.1 tetratricopeptide repeat protein [Leptolyngbya sp. 7M]
MLGVVRDHAISLLREAGEYDILFARLAEHYANNVEKAEPLIQTASPGEIFRVFEIEHDNIRAALKWSFDKDKKSALRIVVALRNFWLLHGHLTEGFNWLITAADHLADATPEHRLKIYSGLGLTARFRGQHDVSRKAYENGLESCIEAGDKQGIAAMNRGLGLVAMQQNVLESARQHFETGLRLSRELEDDYGIAMSLSFLGDLARVEKDHTQARKLFEEASQLFRTMDRKVALGDSLNNLGTSRFLTNDPIAANESFAEAARIAIDIGNKITLSHSLDGFGALRTAESNFHEAAKLAGAAESLRESLGYKNEPAELAFRESYLEKVRHRLSREDFESAYAEGVSSDPVQLAQHSANISGEAKGAGELQYS